LALLRRLRLHILLSPAHSLYQLPIFLDRTNLPRSLYPFTISRIPIHPPSRRQRHIPSRQLCSSAWRNCCQCLEHNQADRRDLGRWELGSLAASSPTGCWSGCRKGSRCWAWDWKSWGELVERHRRWRGTGIDYHIKGFKYECLTPWLRIDSRRGWR